MSQFHMLDTVYNDTKQVKYDGEFRDNFLRFYSAIDNPLEKRRYFIVR